MFMGWKNQYSKNEYTTQSNLQIQCNPYQATNSIFRRTITNNFTICMEIQKTSKNQNNLEKEEWNWKNQPASLQALLQSHSHQESTVLAQRIQINRTEYKAQRSINVLMDTLSQKKEARLYNGVKTSGTGKTGQPLVKE